MLRLLHKKMQKSVFGIDFNPVLSGKCEINKTTNNKIYDNSEGLWDIYESFRCKLRIL